MSQDGSDRCAELQPQLVAYALGEAEPGAEMLAHLAICLACQRDLRGYVQVARILPYNAPDVAPPPALRERILVAMATALRPAPQHVTPPRQLRRMPTFRPAIGLVIAALLALLGWTIALHTQLATQAAQLRASRENWQALIVLLNDPNVRRYPVAGSGASGTFWARPHGQIACLVAQGLPPLTSDRVYQVWLVRGAERTSGGVFAARDGNGWRVVRTSEPLANYDAVEVTVEPRSGSHAPTGRHVLRGELIFTQATSSFERQELRRLLAQAAKPGN